jgi:hypothetical protein
VPHQALPLFGKSESELKLQTLRHVSVRPTATDAGKRKKSVHIPVDERGNSSSSALQGISPAFEKSTMVLLPMKSAQETTFKYIGDGISVQETGCICQYKGPILFKK